MEKDVISGGGGREESQAPARGGLPQQDDKEMIKPTKIDKRAKQLQLCKVGWGQISSCPGVSQSTRGGVRGDWAAWLSL